MSKYSKSPCQMVAHEGNLYEFIWREGSQQAVNLWAHHMGEVYAATYTAESAQMLRLIQRFETFGMPPVSRIVHATRRLQATYPHMPPVRTLVLSESPILVTIVSNLARLLIRQGVDKTHFFTLDAYDEAIQWLLADDAQGV